ncbi:hypothetical protein BX666DRAFT_2028767 [Dichotomocladium elegans]|nr:hypothetical protein BX666DRAFT_2028767 [Dichotomocladium elegans]
MHYDRKQFVFVERKKTLQLAESCGIGIVKEEEYLYGYQIYIIEQWLCDRSITSNTVKVFTGNQSHAIKVCVLSISTAELQHPRPEIQSFFNTYAPLKLKSTDLGEIMLTDPSELPCDMDMVLIPDGDYDKWINQAYVNINLRRTSCTGRSALNLNKPKQVPASEEKFRSIYKIADTVNFESAVIKLVAIAQVALYLFNLLKRDYIDGLICNETTKAFGEFYASRLLTGRQTIKDPFIDFEEFRFDIDNYQRSKGLKRTKFLDLATLEKLNEHTINQLKVRNVIKSKLDDISGSESSDPEVFRHHATMESLRAIWRPRLRNFQSGDAEKPQHELLHMIKGMSARTTRTSGAAAEMISKFAGSLPWVENKQNSFARQRSRRRNAAAAAAAKTTANTGPTPPTGSVPHVDAPITTSVMPPLGTYPTNVQVTTPNGISTVEDVFYPPSREEIDNENRRVAIESNFSSDESSYKSDSEYLPPWQHSSERQETPSPPVGLQSPAVPDFGARQSIASPASICRDTASPMSDIVANGANDFVPLANARRVPRRTRSASDSVVSVHHSLPFEAPREKPVILHRASSLSMIPTMNTNALYNIHNDDSDADIHHRLYPRLDYSGEDGSVQLRPSVTMDIETYLVFEKLQRQHAALREAYGQLQKVAKVYERCADQLRTTYLRRSTEYEKVERTARMVMDQQVETENHLKDVEDASAKLHYELNVLNENLKDVEENVSTFYGKVSLLERKMHESQQSITTMLIIGNYFDYYWQKVKSWIGWTNS